MSAPVLTIVNTFKAIQYIGTNGMQLADVFDGTIDFDDGTTLTFTYASNGEPDQRTFTLGQYMTYNDLSDFGQANLLRPNLDTLPHSAYEELPAGMAEAESPSEEPLQPVPVLVEVQAEGYATLPGSALGGNQTIDVTLSPALPHDGYKPGVELRGSSGLLSGHSISSHQVLDEQTVRVVVNSGALSVAGQVRVWAVASVLEFTSP